MRTIYRYPISMLEPFEISLPNSASIVKAELRQYGPCFWAILETEEPKAERCFVVRGTGRELHDGESYVATWFDGPFVWHLFEVIQ